MWEKLQWKNICELANIPLPPADLPYLDFTPELPSSNSALSAAPKTISTAPKKASVLGLKPKLKT